MHVYLSAVVFSTGFYCHHVSGFIVVVVVVVVFVVVVVVVVCCCCCCVFIRLKFMFAARFNLAA